MNKQAAEKMSRDLIGKSIGGWGIQSYINHGKSAVVFLAEKAGQQAALKVFDPDIVERYGRDNQLKRIERERSLIGKSHPNLISIYGGGEDNGLLYIAMEYFRGANLEEKLLEIPKSEIRSLTAQIASAAKFLEECSFAHRDIKPANIGISDDLKFAKLLDFGVIRPFDLSNVTDEGEQHFFVATLRYSPPELLFREEKQTLEAWRAVTFYQLGAVVHDLLMRKPLFSEVTEPYGRLVRAVEREIPIVNSPDADADLRLLAQNCLATVNGPVPLSRMGSGENWVGYHVLAHLALHKWFRQKERPVPGFLFFDQPSQAHYPPEKDANGAIEGLKDEDQEAVMRLFKLIYDAAEEMAPGMQIIVTDHADLKTDWFAASVIARWRGHEKLVPQEWYTAIG